MPLKHTPPPPSRPQIGVSADPPPANPPGWDSRARPSARGLGSGCTDTRAQPHAGPVFWSQTARASTRTIRSIPRLRPTRNQAPTMRTRGPESPPLARQGRGALGAGPAAPPGKLRESGRPPPHPPPSSPSSASEPSRAGAKPRAPRARAERVTESWRIRPASTVRTDGERTGGRGSLLAAAAPPWLSGPSFLSRHQPGEASCFLLQPRVAWGGHFLVGCGLTVQS